MKILSPEENIAAVTAVIANAKKFVVIVSPFNDLTGWDELKRAINDAAGRHIDVTYYVRKGEGQNGIGDLNVKIAEVPLLHAKMFFSESEGVIGSFNLTSTPNLNWGYTVNDLQSYSEMTGFFEKYIKPIAVPFVHQPLRIALGGDLPAVAVKKEIADMLAKAGHIVKDFGSCTGDVVDYPDYAQPVARAVASQEYDYGILICGSGVGISIAANKVKGIRAALCWNTEITKLSRQHNNANILCFGARFIAPFLAGEMVKVFLATPFDEGVHVKRLGKVKAIEDGRPILE